MKPFRESMQRRVATIAIGPSTVRGQGSDGVVQAARDFLETLNLTKFATDRPDRYRAALDRATLALQGQLPGPAASFGLARKCLNIFLRDAIYNYYLRGAFELEIAEPLLEVPLDSLVAKNLHETSPNDCPRWTTIRGLSEADSDLYQRVASRMAARQGMMRVHLDLYLWRKPDESD